MSEMVERVAEAIAKSRHGESLWWTGETGGLRQSAIDDARAAVAAMREPTQAMVQTVDPAFDHVEFIWQTMIDEALK